MSYMENNEKKKKERLDVLLVKRCLAESREKIRQAAHLKRMHKLK